MCPPSLPPCGGPIHNSISDKLTSDVGISITIIPLPSISLLCRLHTSNYAYSQKGFILSPAPQGTLTSRTGSFVSPYHFSKQHLRGGSMSDSDNSEPPSKIDHFNFRHSPAPAPPASLLIIDEMELKVLFTILSNHVIIADYLLWSLSLSL